MDFSDRLGPPRTRRSYRTSRARRRRRRATDGQGGVEEEYGDFSEGDDQEEEGLERRLARLRREVEEVRVECERTRPGQSSGEGGNKDDGIEDLEPLERVAKLSDALDAVYVSRRGGSARAGEQLQRQIDRFARASAAVAASHQADEHSMTHDSRPPSSQPARLYNHAHVLARAADFDSRLSTLEKHLGLTSRNMPETAEQPPKPILPTLEALDRQITALSSSGASLDQASRRARQLTQEAERLEEARKATRAAHQASSTPVKGVAGTKAASNGHAASYLDDPERVAKVNALYGTLSTIESLAPTLPLVLERLRSLHLVHTSAGHASATLDDMERRQKEQAEEIRQWREALENVEKNMSEGGKVMAGNLKTVDSWVKDLEARVAKLR